MPARILAIGLIFLLCASAGANSSDEPGVAAQRHPEVGDRQRENPQAGYSVKVAVDSVFLNVSVQERKTNRSVAGLKKEDFLVYEDGVPQQVDQFLPSEAPFNLLLLLDVSGSTGVFLSLLRGASTDFIRQLKANDRVAIATFSSRVDLIESFTTDRARIDKTLQRIWAGGGTAFYDALMACVSEYMRGIEGRTAVVVFSDGIDNQLEGGYPSPSQTTFEELYGRVQDAESIIYTIFLDTIGQGPSGPTTTAGGGPGGASRRESSTKPYPDRRRDPTLDPSNLRPRITRAPWQTGPLRAGHEENEDDRGPDRGPHVLPPKDPGALRHLFGNRERSPRPVPAGLQSVEPRSRRPLEGDQRQSQSHPDAVVRTRKGYYARKGTGG